MENLCIETRLTNQRVQFSAVSRTNPDRPVPLDYIPPLGDGQGFAGLELLLVSFCGCVSTAIVALLRKAGHDILSYACSAEGIREENPLSLKKIIFEVRLKSENIGEGDMDRVLETAAAISPVWLAIKNNVEVETKYTVFT